METLYIDRKNCSLEAKQHRLVIHQNNGERLPASFPLTQLESIVITSDCTLSTGTLRKLGSSGVSVVALNPRKTEDAMICYHTGHGNSDRRIRQYAVQLQPDWRAECSRVIVRHKLTTHIRHLQALLKERPDHRRSLIKATKCMKEIWLGVKQNALNESRLLGAEGSAAKAYFEAYTQVFPATLEFTGRKKRPAPDPVNALLSLTYTLIHYEGVRAALSSGLDPQLGILHRPAYGRDSLACDLTELLRAQVNHWVWTLFRDRKLTEHDFYMEGNACLLSKEGRSKYYPLFQITLPAYRSRLRRYCRMLARYLDDSPNLFEPIHWDSQEV